MPATLQQLPLSRLLLLPVGFSYLLRRNLASHFAFADAKCFVGQGRQDCVRPAIANDFLQKSFAQGLDYSVGMPCTSIAEAAAAARPFGERSYATWSFIQYSAEPPIASDIFRACSSEISCF
jgi:hypothetical protein